MKRALFVIAGALSFAALGFVTGSIATNWYADSFAKSDDDINQSIGYFLIAWPLLAIFGGYVGNIMFHKKLTFRSREDADKRRIP